ncbi:hypothetical protein ECG_01451 [Echinococcus granulosus]|nr:hypothetical protein ECG_01451 [Echinococcus granulosus]
MEYSVDPELVKNEIAKNLPKNFFENKPKKNTESSQKDKVLKPYVRPDATDVYIMDPETEVGFEELRKKVDLSALMVEGLGVKGNIPEDELIDFQDDVAPSGEFIAENFKHVHKLSLLKNLKFDYVELDKFIKSDNPKSGDADSFFGTVVHDIVCIKTLSKSTQISLLKTPKHHPKSDEGRTTSNVFDAKRLHNGEFSEECYTRFKVSPKKMPSNPLVAEHHTDSLQIHSNENGEDVHSHDKNAENSLPKTKVEDEIISLMLNDNAALDKVIGDAKLANGVNDQPSIKGSRSTTSSSNKLNERVFFYEGIKGNVKAHIGSASPRHFFLHYFMRIPLSPKQYDLHPCYPTMLPWGLYISSQ